MRGYFHGFKRFMTGYAIFIPVYRGAWYDRIVFTPRFGMSESLYVVGIVASAAFADVLGISAFSAGELLGEISLLSPR